jgi:hypothetical protein
MDDLKERIDNVCRAHFKKGVEELLLHKDYAELAQHLAYIKNHADFTIEVVNHVNHVFSQQKKEVG